MRAQRLPLGVEFMLKLESVAFDVGAVTGEVGPIGVVVALRLALLREILVRLIVAQPDMRLAGQAADVPALHALLRAAPAALLVLDLNLPGARGEALVAALRREHPGLRVLILGRHDQLHRAPKALAAGAGGYLTKDAAPTALLTGMRRVAHGASYIEPAAVAHIACAPAGSGCAPLHQTLSPREMQVLRALARGESVNAIAAGLGLSSKTISAHKARLMQKMRFAHNADLMRYAIDYGLDC